jgi:hypothetical protein
MQAKIFLLMTTLIYQVATGCRQGASTFSNRENWQEKTARSSLKARFIVQENFCP